MRRSAVSFARLSLVATDDEVVETMLALASGEIGEEDLAEWIRSRTQKRQPV